MHKCVPKLCSAMTTVKSLSVGFLGGLYCFLLVNLFWNYTALVDAIHNGEGKCWTTMIQKIQIRS
ncbi:hypothetical protein E1A91_A09G178700v1 [Gossypium mustelinum]|uniref:Uncharacterized protein n=1 Tax=Gossypium mustelinum TaxID=34275 RepID=A0A5D2XZK2_GOSMU|nr:hypothetical protein E1A91_A09G178700v1 [Gossypium mustelinum]